MKLTCLVMIALAAMLAWIWPAASQEPSPGRMPNSGRVAKTPKTALGPARGPGRRRDYRADRATDPPRRSNLAAGRSPRGYRHFAPMGKPSSSRTSIA